MRKLDTRRSILAWQIVGVKTKKHKIEDNKFCTKNANELEFLNQSFVGMKVESGGKTS